MADFVGTFGNNSLAPNFKLVYSLTERQNCQAARKVGTALLQGHRGREVLKPRQRKNPVPRNYPFSPRLSLARCFYFIFALPSSLPAKGFEQEYNSRTPHGIAIKAIFFSGPCISCPSALEVLIVGLMVRRNPRLYRTSTTF